MEMLPQWDNSVDRILTWSRALSLSKVLRARDNGDGIICPRSATLSSQTNYWNWRNIWLRRRQRFQGEGVPAGGQNHSDDGRELR